MKLFLLNRTANELNESSHCKKRVKARKLLSLKTKTYMFTNGVNYENYKKLNYRAKLLLLTQILVLSTVIF